MYFLFQDTLIEQSPESDIQVGFSLGLLCMLCIILRENCSLTSLSLFQNYSLCFEVPIIPAIPMCSSQLKYD